MKRIALMAVFWLAFLGSFGEAATYYVSTTGNNGNSGISSEQAWATPGYGSRQLQPGDTLIILGGRYPISLFDDDIIKPPSGTASHWITVKGEAGHRPVLAGRDNLLSAVDIEGTSYIRVENLEITHDDTVTAPTLYFRNGLRMFNKTENGVVVSSPGHIILQDIYVHHIDEFAMKFQDIDSLQILNCRFEYTGMGGIGSDRAEAGGATGVLVAGCRLARNGYYYQGEILTSPVWDRPDGLGVEEGPGPLEIVDTVSEHNFGDGLDSKLNNTYIHNCVVANNTCDGIKLWGDHTRVENCLVYGTGDGQDSTWSPVVIDGAANYSFSLTNVTVDDIPSRTGYPMIVQYDNPEVPLNLVLRNCIFANTHDGVFIAAAVNLTAAHNLFYRPGGAEQVWAHGRGYTAAEIEAGDLGPGNLSRAPKFVLPAWGTTGNYHLTPGSPGIDQGAATGAPLVDLEYRPRPRGKGFDMGAYEFPAGGAMPLVFFLLEN